MKQWNSDPKIAVFGGGRWSRVLLGVFISNTSPNIKFTVHTKHLAKEMLEWINKNDFTERVYVTDSDPDFDGSKYKAAIVVNALSDHKESAKLAIAAKVPVLIEKPMTPSFKDTFELIEKANNSEVLLSSSWVFLFASYIDNFIERLGDVNTIRAVRFNWTDGLAETRHGETKSFDPAVPVFKDVLPHMLSILSKIFQKDSYRFHNCIPSRGGSCVKIVISISNIKCFLTLERNSDKRRREIIIQGKKNFVLDFSKEPGLIKVNDQTHCGDLSWNVSPSPLEKMATKFLLKVNSRKIEEKSYNKLALSISKLIDQIDYDYQKFLDKWIIEHLNNDEINEKDIEYFLSEIVTGTFQISRNESNDVISNYFNYICSGQALKEFQNTSPKTTNSSFIEFLRLLKDIK